MNQGNKPKLITAPPAKGDQVPPTQSLQSSMPPPKGGGAKPWIIMGVLSLLIAGAIGLLLTLQKKEAEQEAAKKLEEAKKAKSLAVEVEKPKSRPTVSIESRPSKSAMARVSLDDFDELKDHIGQWVILKGKAQTSDSNGLIVFQKPEGASSFLKGQLVRGTVDVAGTHIKVIGWLVSPELIQIDGPEDIDDFEPLTPLPDKEFYTRGDLARMNPLVGRRISFQGEVKKIGKSGNGKNLYVIFKTFGRQFYAVGSLRKLEDGLTEDSLQEFVGKDVRITGQLRRPNKKREKGRLVIRFTKRADLEIVGTSDPFRKQDVIHTEADVSELKELVGQQMIFQGKVRKVQKSNERGVVYIKFETHEKNFFGIINTAELTKRFTLESLRKLIGQEIKLTGQLEWQEWGEPKVRLLLRFTKRADIEVVETLDPLEKKDIYTKADVSKLKELIDQKMTFQGKVKRVRNSSIHSERYIEFKTGGKAFFGIVSMTGLEEEITLESLKGLIGKEIKLTGELKWQNLGRDRGRLVLRFAKKEDYEIVE